jgi:hypothetical protein
MSTRSLPGAKSGRRRVGLTILPPSLSRMSENVGASTSRQPKGLHGLYRDNFTFYLIGKRTWSVLSCCMKILKTGYVITCKKKKRVKPSLLTGREGSRLTDGGEVSLTRWPPFTPRNIPGTHFCKRLSDRRNIMRLEGLGQVKNAMTSSAIEPATFRLVA